MDPTLILLAFALAALVLTIVFPVGAVMMLGVIAFLVGFLFVAGIPVGAYIGFSSLAGLAPLFIGLFMIGFARWAMQRP